MCLNLPKADVFSDSDPMIVTYLKDEGEEYQKINTTEIIFDNLNPQFDEKIIVPFKTKKT